MKSRLRGEGLAFTAAVGGVMAGALWLARDWPIRASIGILVLGSIGVVLAIWQFISETCSKEGAAERSALEAPVARSEATWGNAEIWLWIIGFYVLIVTIGFMLAVPLFVLSYTRFYGARWRLALGLAVVAWGFVYGVFEKLLHVPWPTPLLQALS
jgi:hypothetical protein